MRQRPAGKDQSTKVFANPVKQRRFHAREEGQSVRVSEHGKVKFVIKVLHGT